MLDELSKLELIIYCKENKITGYSGKNKKELIRYINKKEEKDYKVKLNKKEIKELFKKYYYTIYGESPVGIIWRPDVRYIKPGIETYDRSSVNYYTKQWEIFEKPKGKFFTFRSRWNNISSKKVWTIK